MEKKSLRQEIKENLPTLLKMMYEKGKECNIIDDGARIRVYDYEDAWLQGVNEEEAEEFCVKTYTINEFVTRYFFTLKRFLFKLRNEVKEG
ncbi:hypothetical protein DRN85_05720 [Methanosarcinales archaeon]|nr:MAG: hypothetical protein DRN85_05720 [Methanosarcinales archaeon]